MTVLRMDHVGVIVSDLDDAIGFFVELGLELDNASRARNYPKQGIVLLGFSQFTGGFAPGEGES